MSNAGAGGVGGTIDASAGAGGAAGTMGHESGVVGGADGADLQTADAAQSDGGGEEAAPFGSQILFDFVPAEAGGSALGWVPVPGAAGTTLRVVADDQAPLSPTPGALELRGVFPPPDQTGLSSMSLEVTFGDPNTGIRDFTGAGNLHFWIRVVAPGGVLQSFQPFVQGGAIAGYSGTYQPFVSGFDDAWHEYIVPVADQFYLSSVWKLGIQFFAQTAPTSTDADGGDMSTEAGAFADGSAPEGGGTLADANLETGTRADASAVVDANADTVLEAETGTAAESGTQDAATGRAFVVHLDYVWVN